MATSSQVTQAIALEDKARADLGRLRIAVEEVAATLQPHIYGSPTHFVDKALANLHRALGDSYTGGRSQARRYSGEFPDEGPDTVDGLVAALTESVTRVRAKYGAAVRVIVAMTGREPEDVLAEMDAAGARLQAEREG